MGLGTVSNGSNGLFLSIAGGFIWNRKADEDDPNFAKQEYEKADGSKGERRGARYADLTGVITNVLFRSHDEYGDNINVYVESDGETYILSVGLGSRNINGILKMLLVADLSKPVFIKPYDFIGKDKKRSVGISFRQDGEKLDLKINGGPRKDKEWFENASKRDVKRFFEDVVDHFVDRVKSEIIPKFKNDEKVEESEGKKSSKNPTKKEEISSDKMVKETPLKMKKFLRAFITENYEDKELPSIKGEELVKWYNLALNEEELPFLDSEAEVDQDDLDAQINGLLEEDE